MESPPIRRLFRERWNMNKPTSLQQIEQCKSQKAIIKYSHRVRKKAMVLLQVYISKIIITKQIGKMKILNYQWPTF